MFKFNFKYFVPAFFIIVFGRFCFASEPKDSVVKSFPAISVTAQRILSDKELVFNSSTILSKADISQSGAWQISQAMENQPGIFIKDYGGLGGLKTISTRGTTSSQTLIMLDGMRINNTQSGTLDLSILPISFLDNIEIIRGGTSGLFGGNSIGGVINLNSSNSEYKSGKINLHFGSFEELFFGFNFNHFLEDSNCSIGFQYSKTKGDYPFKINQFGVTLDTIRKNGDFSCMNFFLSEKISFGNWKFKTTILPRISFRGTPGAVLQGYIESANSRLNENDLLLISKASNQIDNSSELNFGFLARVNKLDYIDPDFLPLLAKDTTVSFTGRNLQLNSTFQKKFGINEAFISIEGEYSDLRGNMLQLNTGGFVTRTTLALSGRLLTDFISTPYFSFQSHLGARLDEISGIGAAVSPFFGMILAYPDYYFQFRSHISYNFRPPSFNEMYYLNYGNSNLKPERSLSFNMGLNYKPLDNIFLDASYFFILTKNLITTRRTNLNTYTSENTDLVSIDGIEFTGKANLFNKNLNITLNYTLQSTVDSSRGSVFYGTMLPYTPQELISMNINYKLENITAGFKIEYTSFYYSLPGENLSSIIPSHKTLDFNILYTFKIKRAKICPRLDILNIFDERFSIIKNYPMPGRMLRLGITMEYEKNKQWEDEESSP